eukprot:g2822.t1
MKLEANNTHLFHRRRAAQSLPQNMKPVSSSKMPWQGITPWQGIPFIFLLFLFGNVYVRDSRRQFEATTVPDMKKMLANMALDVFSFNDADCLSLIRNYSESYNPQISRQTIDLQGPVYASYKWSRPMKKAQIDLQKNRTGEKEIAGNCRVIYKIKDSVLYAYTADTGYQKLIRESKDPNNILPHYDRFEQISELLLVTLHLYNIPDMDFAVELADSVTPVTPADPVFSFSLRAEKDKEGFTIPSYGAYMSSIGSEQFLMLRECMKTRYPKNNRIEKVVWRGTTTGRPMITEADVPLNPRVSLSSIGDRNPKIFDVGVVDYIQVDLENSAIMNKLRKLAPLRKRIRVEKFNNYAAVVDIDGNSWSDRLPILLLGETIILKQEYIRWLDYMAYSLEASEAVVFFKKDQTNFKRVASDLILEYQENKLSWLDRLEKMHAFAQEHTSQTGVIRAMAYALTRYASFQDWEVSLEDGYTKIPKTNCCKFNDALPTDLVKDIVSSE